MERLPARLTDLTSLSICGEILSLQPPPAAAASLRQRLYQAGFRWPDLITFAAAQDILPPLIWALRTQHLLLPAPKGLSPEQRKNFVTTRLSEAHAAHQLRQADLRDQLFNGIVALNQAGIRPVVLKGARYLLEDNGHWGSARPMRDIDLLIRPDEAELAVRAFTDIGYQADGATGLQHQHLPELRLAGRHGLVELHTEALAPAAAKFMPTTLVWQNAVPAMAAGIEAFILPPAWQALHALLHHQAADDGYNQHTLALKPLWEFSSLTGTLTPTDWDAVIAQMAPHGGTDLLASWCLQAKRVFGLSLPETLPISATALAQVAACFQEAMQPEPLRRWRFVMRQLRRGFSGEMLAMRYGRSAEEVGLSLRARHAWFLLRRYRSALGARLLHP